MHIYIRPEVVWFVVGFVAGALSLIGIGMVIARRIARRSPRQ